MKSFMLYFGCWDESGHYLWDRNKMKVHDPAVISPMVLRVPDLDGSLIFLPRLQEPGRGQITHIVRGDNAVSVLAWWDRTFDQRPGSCALIQCSGWDDADNIWIRFSHVYATLAPKLTQPSLR